MTTITIPDGNTISVTSFDNNSYLVQANTQLVIANGGIVSGLITVTGNPAGRGGGNLEVQSGGTALNTIVSSGGYTRVSGAALNTTISSGGNLEVDAGGSALTTVVSSAGNMYQAFGGYVSGLTVSRGGQVQIGGTATAIVDNGGGDNVFSAGTAVGTVVVNGGSESVNAGGVASGTVVSGGNQFVKPLDDIEITAISSV
jgi:autotransporter passenger strand-loop-strand repeat protein